MMKYLLPLGILLSFTALNAQPDTALVGIYLTKVDDIDFFKNTFNSEFWVWLNYKKKDNSLLVSTEFPNLKYWEKSNDFTENQADVCWEGAKVSALVSKKWDLSKIPFDQQVLEIEIENSDLDVDALVFVADTIESHIDQDLSIEDWSILSSKMFARNKQYNTSYGDPKHLSSVQYPRAVLEIGIKRKGIGLFLSLFTGMYISFFISLMVFFLGPTDLDPRFGLSTASLFAAIGNRYAVNSLLPQSTSLMLVDKLHIITFLFLFFTIICSVISLRMWKRRQFAKSKKFDLKCFYALLFSYIIANVLTIIIAIYL